MVALASVADFAQELHVAFGVAPALANRNDMIVLKSLPASTLYAFAFVASPYVDTNTFRNLHSFRLPAWNVLEFSTKTFKLSTIIVRRVQQ